MQSNEKIDELTEKMREKLQKIAAELLMATMLFELAEKDKEGEAFASLWKITGAHTMKTLCMMVGSLTELARLGRLGDLAAKDTPEVKALFDGLKDKT